MRNILFLIITILLFFSCNWPTKPKEEEPLDKFKKMADFDNWPGKNGQVRAAVILSKNLIPSLEGTTVARQDAHEYFITRRFNSSMPIEARVPKKEQPNLAGDISFNGGRDFIRNNIVVEIYTDGEMVNKTGQIAKDIDALLLTSPTVPSAQQMRPEIKRFEIAQNPVIIYTSPRLFIEVSDPLEGRLAYFWRFSSEGVGIIKAILEFTIFRLYN